MYKLRKILIHPVITKFKNSIEGAPPETFPNDKYDAPEELGGDSKCFDSPIKKLGLFQIFDVNSSSALILCSLTVFFCP